MIHFWLYHIPSWPICVPSTGFSFLWLDYNYISLSPLLFPLLPNYHKLKGRQRCHSSGWQWSVSHLFIQHTCLLALLRTNTAEFTWPYDLVDLTEHVLWWTVLTAWSLDVPRSGAPSLPGPSSTWETIFWMISAADWHNIAPELCSLHGESLTRACYKLHKMSPYHRYLS